MGIRLSDIELTPDQAAALINWLDQLVQQNERKQRDCKLAAEREAFAEQCYAKVCELARETALMHGRLVGIHPQDQAEMTWTAFRSSEAYFSPYDVDEHFDPASDDIYREGWVAMYISTLEEMARTGIARKEPSPR